MRFAVQPILDILRIPLPWIDCMQIQQQYSWSSANNTPNPALELQGCQQVPNYHHQIILRSTQSLKSVHWILKTDPFAAALPVLLGSCFGNVDTASVSFLENHNKQNLVDQNAFEMASSANSDWRPTLLGRDKWKKTPLGIGNRFRPRASNAKIQNVTTRMRNGAMVVCRIHLVLQ
jgi:hypothetical protein